MSTSKHIDKICIAVVCIVLALCLIFICAGSIGIESTVKALKYEKTLFDTSYVHSIDIVMNDWDEFIENCESEEYSTCTVVIDGEKHADIAMRAKGNTSLSNVKSMNSQRYSFKMEFDHYEDSKTLDGLDKLCLNNLIQDNTMMKDYIVYRLMAEFGVNTPLCSFAYLTVNGEDWGLYLAVEGVEDSFLARNYGSDTGNLYKPDSMSFGGGRGNGKGFDMDDFDFGNNESKSSETNTDKSTKQTTDTQQSTDTSSQSDGKNPQAGGEMPQGGGDMPQGGGDMPQGGGEMPQGFDPSDFNPEEMQGGFGGMTPPDMNSSQTQDSTESKSDVTASATTNNSEQSSDTTGGSDSTADSGSSKSKGGFGGDNKGFGGGGMGSDDVKLKYIDDDPDSYSNIFDNAKTDIDDSDKERLIKSLKNLSSYTDIENTVQTEEVMRYFVVHNFVCNGDSYTGSMIHNYYLHEKDGLLGMIPWDYNLAFGTFQGNNASSTVNTSIDSPVSGGTVDDRPMLGWIFSNEEYTEQYHEYFSEFMSEYFDSGYVTALISETAEMIRPYVEKDPTKFCTTEEFESGVVALTQFCTLRAEAVNRQLSGDTTMVDTGDLNLSDMGTMGGGKGGQGDGNMPEMKSGSFDMTSMFKVTDSNGNEVELSTIISDTSAITTITMKDGSTVDVSSGDFKNLMNVDFSNIASVTDKDGNITDLSGYTITFSKPDMQSMGSIPSMPNQSSDNSSNPQEKPQGDTGNAQPNNTEQSESAQSTDSAQKQTSESEQSTGSAPSDSSQSDSSQSDSKSTNRGNPPDNMQFGGQNGNSAISAPILFAVSVAFLAIGLIIAYFKKY